jgi:hypothetical protein
LVTPTLKIPPKMPIYKIELKKHTGSKDPKTKERRRENDLED